VQRTTLENSEEALDENAATDNESAALRAKYLTQMNNLWAAEERIGDIEQEIIELKKEKNLLEGQLDRIKPVDEVEDQKLVNLIYEFYYHLYSMNCTMNFIPYQ